MKISVVIPVLNAERHLPGLLRAIFAQQPQPPEEVVLVDSMSRDRTRELAATEPRARVVPIANFSHGRARNLGMREARGDVVAMLSQDAMPANEHWLAELVEPFADPRVAGAFSRQVPRDDAGPIERFYLAYNFPPGGPVRRERHGDGSLRLRDVFFSDVSAAYRRELLLRHPFDESLIMCEDQQASRDLIRAGYATVYRPDSVVVHSHTYSLAETFRRYFDSAYAMGQVFEGHGFVATVCDGRGFLLREAAHIVRRAPWMLPYYFLFNVVRTGGTIAGRRADRLPRRWVRRMSMHAYHWR